MPSRTARGRTWKDHAVFNSYSIHAVDGCVNTLNWRKGVEKHGNIGVDAIHNEIKQLLELEVFVAMPRTIDLSSITYHRSHDLFDIKSDGSAKARLVVGKPVGEQEIDFGLDPYSPTIDGRVINMMLTLCVESKLELEVWDVKGAYLKAPMKISGVYVLLRSDVSEVVVKMRPEWSECLRHDGSLLVECRKAWYGTVIAAACWNTELNDTLTEVCGYTRHSMVPCLYYRVVDGVTNYILLHVDDMGAMMSHESGEHERVRKILESHYGKMKVQRGDAVTYIGMEVKRDHVGNCFEVRMCNKVDAMCKKFNITECRRTPGDMQMYHCEDPSASSVDVSEYRSMVMTARYIAGCVMPEILYHISHLATKQCNPTCQHLRMVTALMAYMLCNRDRCIRVNGYGGERVLHAYCDASYGVHADGKSHSGRCIFFGKCRSAILVASSKQSLTVDSVYQAEIVALGSVVLVGDYLQNVLRELGMKDVVVRYYCDNEASVNSVLTGTNRYATQRRYFVVRINSLKDYFKDEANEARIEHISTHDNIADVLTKPLAGKLFMHYRSVLHGETDSG